MGRKPQDLARLQRTGGCGLVGALLSSRKFKASNGAAVRRLSLGQLRHQNENCNRMECRLRTLPWPGKPTCIESKPGEYRESSEARFRSGNGHLHSMPLAGPASKQSDQRPELRLA